MRNYNYKARDNSGRLIKGVLVAENELELANHLNKLGCFLIEAKAFTAATVSKSSSKKDFKLSPVEVLNITTQLAISLDSGVPLLTSLKDLSVGSPDKKTKAILEDIAHRVESGTTLKEHSRVEPPRELIARRSATPIRRHRHSP
ncbi:MAG: type II secretion system F family protein, partial [Candidatus Omnitrophica bacterium]|nr:type II secretion system F family protein [Candidatus Omnitrophota bacterium]